MKIERHIHSKPAGHKDYLCLLIILFYFSFLSYTTICSAENETTFSILEHIHCSFVKRTEQYTLSILSKSSVNVIFQGISIISYSCLLVKPCSTCFIVHIYIQSSNNRLIIRCLNT